MTKLPEGFLQAPIAHRALHDAGRGRVENSRAAIEAAMAAGYAIEMDLQLSHDHQAMVFHDYHLDRLTGETGPVLVRDAAELTRIKLGEGEDGIPTFAEALELVAGRVPLLIELKDQHGTLGVTNGALEQAVARALRRYTGPCAVMSFNPNMVAELARLLPDIPRGLVTSEFEGSYWAHLPEEVGLRLR
ncbi:MAG: glycerophosphodiester phosphodiesterase family protein, partial [Pseudomonadota bacterium]